MDIGQKRINAGIGGKNARCAPSAPRNKNKAAFSGCFCDFCLSCGLDFHLPKAA
nr:MAG TPA: hypothetical protein [Caudoviricetes sp.]